MDASEKKAPIFGEWQPIATAPRTGVAVFLYQPWRSGYNERMIGHYANGWVWQSACDRCPLQSLKPTHWMPLPAGPRLEPAGAAASRGDAEGAETKSLDGEA